jgi:hypothetical protein
MFQVLLMFDNYGVVSELHGVDMLEIVRVATPYKQATCGFAWHMHTLDNACYYF